MRKRVEIDVTGEFTELPEFINEKVADLFLINDGDLAYTKIRFDQRSVATLTTQLGNITDPIARVIGWIAVWDMWRDAEVTSGDFTQLLLEGLRTEHLIGVVAGLGADLVTTVEVLSDPAQRNEQRLRISAEVELLVRNAPAGSDLQLQLVRIFAAISITSEQIEFLRSILKGELIGLEIDRDLRWFLTFVLAERGAITRSEIDAVWAEDRTIPGEIGHAKAIAALPDPAIKADTWKALLGSDLSTSKRAALNAGFMRSRQVDLLAAYVDPYFDALLEMWSSSSFEVASSSVELLFPRYIITPETLAKTDSWLTGVGKDAPEVLRRLVSEGRDALSRALRIQSKDASGA